MSSPGKKRKSSFKCDDGSLPNTKKIAEVFREQLKEEDPLPYIQEYFLDNKDEEKVSDYIKAGGSVSEIAKILENIDLKKRDTSSIIFSALQLVVIQSISDIPDCEKFEDDCRQFVASYIAELQAILTSKSSVKYKKIVLKLLTSISLVSTRLANQILTLMTLSEADLRSLTSHTDPADDATLRVAFIHFVLSFIIDKPLKIVEKLLFKKFWLPSIFYGLKFDSTFTVQLVLSTLTEKIVNNPAISKSSKVLAFNAKALYHLSELYSWSPKSWYEEEGKTYSGIINEEDLPNIRNWVHNLLLKICSSSKFGIVFQDEFYGTTQANKNYILINFLQMVLKDPNFSFVDPSRKDLVQQTFVTCPDIIKPVLMSQRTKILDFTTNSSEIESLISQVFVKIYVPFKNLDQETCLKIIEEIIIPKYILDPIKVGVSNSSDKSLQLAGMKCLSKILSNFCKYFEELSERFGEEKIQTSLSPFFVNHLPNCVQLLKLLTSSIESEDANVTGLIVELLILYDQICPRMFDIMRHDRTINGILDKLLAQNDPKNIPLILNLLRLEIILYPHDTYQEYFLERLKLISLSEDASTIKVTLNIIEMILKKSGLFIRNPNEILLWMYCIQSYFSSDIGELMAYSFQWAIKNVTKIHKCLLKAQEKSSLEEISGLNLDDFLKVSANKVNDRASLQSSVSNSILELSPLLPSLLHILSSGELQCRNDDFLVAFIIHNFHQQSCVGGYFSLLKAYPSETVTRVLSYVESWLSQPVPLSVRPLSKSVFGRASKFILKGKGTVEEVTGPAAAGGDSLTAYERELLLEECLFTACELSRLSEATSDRLDRLLILTQDCLGSKVRCVRPAFLTDFHPLRPVGDADLTTLVLLLSEHSQTSASFLQPFSHRLAFELKYAKKVVHRLEDESRLHRLLNIFTFSPSDTQDLLNYVLSLKSKYFHINDSLSPWVTITEHILTRATQLKISAQEEQLISFLNSLNDLIKKSLNLSQLISIFLKYLKEIPPEMCGYLLDSFSDTFYVLCEASNWYEEFAVFIFRHTELVDFSRIPTERSITLLASRNDLTKKSSSVILSDSAGTIYQGLCERPTPKWIEDLKKIASEIPVDTCSKICKRIKKHRKDIYPSVNALSCIEIIFNKSEEQKNLFVLVLDLLRDSFESQTLDRPQSEKMCSILKTVLESSEFGDPADLETIDQKLMKYLLLYGLKLPSSPLIEALWIFVQKNMVKIPPGELFDLLCSHSCYLDVMIGNSEAKCSVLNLMLLLLNRDGTLLNATHLPLLLSSYRATLSRSDQIILKILQIYEKIGGINLSGWKPYVWGEAAVDHYSVRENGSSGGGGAVGTQRTNHTATLQLLSKEMVQATITRFPLYRDLDTDYSGEEDAGIYDPAFYLPLLCQVAPGMRSGWRFSSSGALALTLAALASGAPSVRAAAYQVLFRFYTSLQESKQQDNMIWKHLLEALRGGVASLTDTSSSSSPPPPPARLSSIVSTFLARASLLMASPTDPLYPALHNFLYAKPTLKLSRVPAFLELFHFSRDNHRVHQTWLLEVIRDGLREPRDLQLALNSFVFKFILDFHSSTLSSAKIKGLIESIVVKCLQDIDDKQLLLNNYSIIPWIISANRKLIKNLPQKLISHYTSLKNSLPA